MMPQNQPTHAHGVDRRGSSTAHASQQQQAYSRIGVSDDDTDEEALRKAEPLLVSRAATYTRMGFDMWEVAWTAVANGASLPAIGDIGHVEPAFAALVQALPPDPDAPCFVPGCGQGYAVECLALSGRRCIGLEISPSAARLAKERLVAAGVEPPSAEIVVGDFFEYEPSEPFSLIYDATFLCSLPPAWRDAWAMTMKRLMSPGGELIMDVFPVGAYEGGPPFAMSLELVRGLLEPHGFVLMQQSEVPVEQRARPLFRGTSEWLMRWQLETEELSMY